MLSIEVVLNQCYYNPYHIITQYFLAHYLSTIFSSFFCSIPRPQRRNTIPSEYHYILIVTQQTQRGVSFLLYTYACLCVYVWQRLYIHAKRCSSVLNIAVCYGAMLQPKNMRARPSKHRISFRIQAVYGNHDVLFNQM